MPRTVYTAAICIAVAADSEAEACDAISAAMSANLMQSGALVDWKYVGAMPRSTGLTLPLAEGAAFAPRPDQRPGGAQAVDKWDVFDAIERYGGDFEFKLCDAWRHADADNFQRLMIAFPETWAEFTEFAKLDKARTSFSV